MYCSSLRGTFTIVLALCALSLSLAQLNPEDISDYDDNLLRPRPAAYPPIYRPVPQAAPPPKNPNVILVPRLGLVRGNVGYKTLQNRTINTFLGLKYGVVGRGLARFQRALRPDNLSNAIIDATQEPANCPQFPDLQQITAAEARNENIDNCLTLNVYAPNKPGLYPVMVFIHGEMLFDGSAEEGQPDYLLEQDIVLVSVNYRLAPFGFLTTLTNDLPGNVALADIQMALEWVQLYIRAFSGNPEQVTVFGQAGGATLVHALSLSGKAQGLYHKLILQSGTALNPYFLDEDPLSTARSFARLARCFGGTEAQRLSNCFDRLRTSELLNIFKRHWEANEPRGLRFTGGFKLVVGDKLGYLNQHPAALLANNNVPIIAGVTKDAGAFILSRFYNQLTQVRTRNITDFINVVLKHTTQPRHYQIWKHWALQHIFTEEDARNPTVESLAQGLLELANLVLYREPIIDAIRHTYRKHATYLYCFDYRGEFHRFGDLKNPLPFETDATLSDDNIYLFPYPLEVSQLNTKDKAITRTITSMWTNFAQYSVPYYDPTVWPNVTTEYGPFLRFSNSNERVLELDYHFGEGIPMPNLYPEFSYNTTTNASKITTTTRVPYHLAHVTVLDGPNTQNQRYAHNPYASRNSNYDVQRSSYTAF